MSNASTQARVAAIGLLPSDRNEEHRTRIRSLVANDASGSLRRGLNVDQRVVIMGLRDRDSIAYHAAKELLGRGARVGVTFWQEKIRDKVQGIADELGVDWCLPCDVSSDEEITALFPRIAREDGWGGRCIDGIVHSIAFATQMASIADVTTQAALDTIKISALSYSRTVHAALPQLKPGAAAIALGYSGADRLEPGYDGAIGGAKAMLDFIMRSMAMDLGKKNGIRFALVSPAPMQTSAASGLPTFNEMYGKFLVQSPLHKSVEGRHVGHAIAQLIAPGAERISGINLLVDGARSVVA